MSIFHFHIIFIVLDSAAALKIERVFRGHVGRKFCRQARKRLQMYKQFARLHYFVAAIQKSFRGYYSRKYKQNYASRKKYVQQVVTTAAEVRERLQIYSSNQLKVCNQTELIA